MKVVLSTAAAVRPCDARIQAFATTALTVLMSQNATSVNQTVSKYASFVKKQIEMISEDFYQQNTEVCQNFDKAVKESIRFMEENSEDAMEITIEERSALLDDILKDEK